MLAAKNVSDLIIKNINIFDSLIYYPGTSSRQLVHWTNTSTIITSSHYKALDVSRPTIKKMTMLKKFVIINNRAEHIEENVIILTISRDPHPVSSTLRLVLF